MKQDMKVNEQFDISVIDRKLYVEHRPDCLIHSEEKTDSRIFRYTSLATLLSLLGNNTLYVAKRDTFTDLREHGKFKDIKHRFNFMPVDLNDEEKAMMQSCFQQVELSYHSMYASCWTLDFNEQFTMWQAYTGNGIGVRIGSSIDKILDTIELNDEYILYCGSMRYNKESWKPIVDMAMFNKTEHYEHEKEFRFYLVNKKCCDLKSGIEIKVDAEKIIDEIVLSPLLYPKVTKVIIEMLEKHFEFLKGKIHASEIMEY